MRVVRSSEFVSVALGTLRLLVFCEAGLCNSGYFNQYLVGIDLISLWEGY